MSVSQLLSHPQKGFFNPNFTLFELQGRNKKKLNL